MSTSKHVLPLAFALASLTAACSAQKGGEIVLALRTELAVPKDIDQVQIKVTQAKGGATLYDRAFVKKDGEGEVVLPSTIGILEKDESVGSIKIQVFAFRNADAAVRVAYEVVTTIPPERTVTLPVLLQFLCADMAEPKRDASGQVVRDANGDVILESSCDPGFTCVSGACVPSDLESGELTTYEPGDVFGGGSEDGDGLCFDVTQCLTGGTHAALDLEHFTPGDETSCRFTAPSGEFNAAIETAGAGVCGEGRCLVVLDAESDTGWRLQGDGTAVIPAAFCKKALLGEVAGVVTAPASGNACPVKEARFPICGPWSSVGSSLPDDPKLPVVIASGQINPVSLAYAGLGVYFTSRGTFDPQGNANEDGSVRAAALVGGQARSVATGLRAPHDLVAHVSQEFVYWTVAGEAPGANRIDWTPLREDEPKPLLEGLALPEGLALLDKALYFTDLADNDVKAVTIDIVGNTPLAGAPTPIPGSTGNAPRRVAALQNVVCWTFEDKLGSGNGSVACSIGGAAPTVVADAQATPRAIALGRGATGQVNAVYWANFDAQGAIRKAAIPLTGLNQYEELAKEAYPNGLTVDGDEVFWTSRSRGTVVRFANDETTDLVKGQNNPGAITAIEHGDPAQPLLFWVNEGTPDQPDGAIMKLAR
jgi:hypothetical protein